MSNKFKFYTPVEIKKSKDDKGKDIMKIGGIASTKDEDSDGEFLDPNGFILDDFLKVGFVNWHHQAKNKPKTIVGEPSLAEIRPDGLYVECDLYPSSEIAKEIYETAQILEKDSKTRRLGFSIEGEVIERGSEDETHPDFLIVKKANITGLAITHMPKNAATFAQIIKGFTGDEGVTDTSDSNVDDDSSLNTKNGKAIIKESLNKKIKKLVPDVNSVEKSKFEIINLGEEKMYDKIFDTFTDINIEKAEKVFTLLTKISQDMKKGKINDDKLEKAMSALGLEVNEANPFLSKAKSEETDEEDDSDDADEKVKAAAKKIADKVQKEEFGTKVEKAEGDEDEEDDEDDKDDLKKSKESSNLSGNQKGLFLLFSKEIQKAKSQNTVENRALGVLVKGILDENQLLKGHIEKQNDMFSSQVNLIESQTELIKGLVEKIESFGAVPDARKSITKGYAEKFAPENREIEKGANVLSISKNRTQILEILDAKTFAKGFDDSLSKACTTFESTGKLPADILNRLKVENGITITE
jgi:hypothetical protein